MTTLEYFNKYKNKTIFYYDTTPTTACNNNNRIYVYSIFHIITYVMEHTV